MKVKIVNRLRTVTIEPPEPPTAKTALETMADLHRHFASETSNGTIEFVMDREFYEALKPPRDQFGGFPIRVEEG